MVGLLDKLNQLGMDSSFAKSTAGDGLPNHDNELFKDWNLQNGLMRRSILYAG